MEQRNFGIVAGISIPEAPVVHLEPGHAPALHGSPRHL